MMTHMEEKKNSGKKMATKKVKGKKGECWVLNLWEVG